jgi:hypothetical protein
VVEFLGMAIWMLFSVLFFGLRDETFGTDSAAYLQHATMLEQTRHFDDAFEWGYNCFVLGLVSVIGANHVLLAIETLFVLLMLWTCRLWFGSHSLLGLLGAISVFAYYNLAFNVIRSGLAVGLWLCGMFLFLKKPRGIGWIPCFILAVSFHYTMLAPIAVTVLVPLTRNRLLRWFLVIAIVVELSFSRMTELLLRAQQSVGLIGRYVAKYFGQGIEYDTQFRFDFLFYCLAFYFIMAIGLRRLRAATAPDDPDQRRLTVVSRHLWGIYTALTGIFVLAFGVPYSDRVGIFSFIVAPIGCLYIWLAVCRQRRTMGAVVVLWLCCCTHFALTIVYMHREGVW